MKKKRFAGILLAGACVLSAAFGLAACNGPEETPSTNSGGSTTIVTDKAPDELTPENAIYAFLQKQSELQSYMITSEGEAVADLAGYRQQILNITYKNGEDYLNQASSESALVKMKHQSFSKGGKVVYRNSFSGEMKVAEKDEYKKVYGFTADDVTLGGYVINAKTLRFAELREKEGDTLTYYFRLAGDRSLQSGASTGSATEGVRVQAKTYGSLDDLPAYSDVDVFLKVKKDWTPVSYTTKCSYVGKKVFEMSIEQSLTSTYSLVNQNVEIPDVKAFNEKLGSAPSVIEPPAADEDPATQLLSAFGNTLDEANTLDMPVTVNVSAFGLPISLGGDLNVTVKHEGLQSGNYFDAFSLRLDLDLSEVPLLSGIANSLTVRYPGEGLILLTLANKTETGVTNVFSYPLDLTEKLSPEMLGLLTPDALQIVLSGAIGLEKTETAYELVLKKAAVDKLNAVYAEMIGKLSEQLGDTHGLISSFLGLRFTDVEADFAIDHTGDAEKLSEIVITANTEPVENTMPGEKLDVAVKIGLLSGAIKDPIPGELQLHLDPPALWTGNYFGIAKASLHLDLSPAAGLLGTLGTLPVKELPAFLGDMRSLDVFYTGDGLLTVVIYNGNEQAINVTEVDLKETIGGPSAMAAEADEVPGEAQPALGGLLPVTITVNEDGVTLVTTGPIVETLNAAYNGLVDSIVASAFEGAGGGIAGSAAAGLLNSYLKADITSLNVFFSKTEAGKLSFDFSVMGIPYQKEDAVCLLGLGLADRGALTAEELAALVSGEKPAAIRERNAQAKVYADRLQALIDYVDVSEAGMSEYADEVTTLKAEIEALSEEVRLLIPNASYLEDKKVLFGSESKPLLLLMQENYRKQVDAFLQKIPQDDNYDSFGDDQWTALNTAYESGASVTLSDLKSIAIPAVKDCQAMIDAIGESRISAYLAAREAYEGSQAQELLTKIQACAAEFGAKTTEEEFKAALTDLVKNIKPAYAKIAEGKKPIVASAYDDYALAVCTANLRMIQEKYADLQKRFGEFFAGDAVTVEGLLPLLKEFSELYTWNSGWDYWPADAVQQDFGGAWDSGIRDTLQEGSKAALQAEIDAVVSARATFLQNGETPAQILSVLGEEIKSELTSLKARLDPCRKKVLLGYTYTMSKLGTDTAELNATLQTMQGLRFLFDKMISADQKTAYFEGNDALATFTKTDLKAFEKELIKYLKTLPEA